MSSTAAGRGLLPTRTRADPRASDETSAPAGTRISACQIEQEPICAGPALPAHGHRETTSHQERGGLSHSNRKQICVSGVEGEEPTAWGRAGTAGRREAEDSHVLRREITRWARDENQGEGQGKASWISGLSGGRAEPVGGGGPGGSHSGVWGNLCSRQGLARGEAVVGVGVRSTQDGAWRT